MIEPDPDATIYSLCDYHKYWLNFAAKIKNPNFDVASGRILNLKDKEGRSAVELFSELLSERIPTGVTIAVVPSHNPESTWSGIREIARMLTEKDREDATDCLMRNQKIPKLAGGGGRSLDVHLKSISVVRAERIRGKEVWLIDDVTTTGNSLRACRQLLLNAGARRVQMYAIGKTVYE